MVYNNFPSVNINNNEFNSINTTRFGELTTAFRVSQMNFKPTWGISNLRYTVLTGSNNSITEVGGEFKLFTTNANNSSSLQTIQRGQYQAGTVAQAGIGIRLDSYPISSQYAEWGYYDDNNGFGFGVDITSSYIFYKSGGTKTKIYQTNWNADKLNGSGTSGYTLDYRQGIVSQIDFVWYGYGDIDFVYYPYNSVTGDIEPITVHHLKILNSASIIDPNQPLTMEVGNGPNNSDDFSLYIGGHQFSIIDGDSTPQRRVISELISNFTTAQNTNWQPIIAIRKKTTHGPSNRLNSVKVAVLGYEVSSDGEVETRLTYKGITTTGSWSSPTGWNNNESAVETKISTGYVLAASPEGYPSSYNFSTSTKNNPVVNVEDSVKIPLNITDEVILWVRRLTGSGTIIIKHAHIDWEEEW